MCRLLVSCFVFSLLLLGTNANATTVNYQTSTPFFNNARLNFQIGDTGTYSTNNGHTFDLTLPVIGLPYSFGTTLEATIPAQSQIVFSYTTSDAMTTSGANIGGLISSATSFALANTNMTTGTSTIDVPDSSGLLVIIASFIDSKNATIIFKNFGTTAASITQALAAGVSTFVTGAYSVSAIPLPAALPLMGVGLLALWGVSRRNSCKAV